MDLARVMVSLVVATMVLVAVLSRAGIGEAYSVGRRAGRELREEETGREEEKGARAGDMERVAVEVERALERYGTNETEENREALWGALDEAIGQQGARKGSDLLETMEDGIVEAYMDDRCRQNMRGKKELVWAFVGKKGFSIQDCVDKACEAGQVDTIREIDEEMEQKNIAVIMDVPQKREMRVKPRERAIRKALRGGHEKVIEYLFERGVVTRKRSRAERISVENGQSYWGELSWMLERNNLSSADIGIDEEERGNWFMVWLGVVEEIVGKTGEKARVVEYGRGYKSLEARFNAGGLNTDKLWAGKGYEKGGKEIRWFWMEKTSKVRYEVGTRDANRASKRGQLELVKVLVENGVEPGQNGVDGACDGGHAKVVEYILKQGIQPREWVMNRASRRGDVEMVRVLVEGVPELRRDETEKLRGDDARTDFADSGCESGRIEVVRYLIGEGIRPSTEGADRACESGSVEIVKYLIGEGIRPSTEGADRACEEGHIEVVRVVMNMTSGEVKPSIYGANSACKNGDIDMVKLLGENGVLPDLRGETIARRMNFTEIIDYLELQRAAKKTLSEREQARDTLEGVPTGQQE